MKIHGNTISKHLLPLDFPTLYFFASTLLPGLYTSSIHLFVLLHPSIPSLRPFLVSIPPISLFHFLLPTAPFFVSSLTLVSIPSGLYSLFHSSCLLLKQVVNQKPSNICTHSLNQWSSFILSYKEY